MSTQRIPAVVPGSRPELHAIEARITAARGRISPLYGVLLNSPAVVEGWEALLTAIRQKTGISARLRELTILRVAVLNRAPYEFEAHVSHAQAAGMSDALIEALRAPVSPDDISGLQPVDRVVLHYTDSMTRDIHVPNAIYDDLRAHFDEQAIVELTATIAAYNMVSRFLSALKIGH